jgi:hypothetical protein
LLTKSITTLKFELYTQQLQLSSAGRKYMQKSTNGFVFARPEILAFYDDMEARSANLEVEATRNPGRGATNPM